MQLLSFDTEKCNKDGICIRECPFGILKADDSGIPEMIDGAEKVCLRCGHCLAVCPAGAVTFNGVTSVMCEPAWNGTDIDGAAMLHLLKTRRSVRVYKKKSVPREAVGQLMDAVRWAPTAKNVQPVEWILTDDREKIRQMAGMTIDWLRQFEEQKSVVKAWDSGWDIILRDAPLLAVAHAVKDSINPSADCAIAAASLELAASAMGIGGCWAGYFMRAANFSEPLKELLGLPEKNRVYAALMLGYPKFKYYCIPPRQESALRWL